VPPPESHFLENQFPLDPGASAVIAFAPAERESVFQPFLPLEMERKSAEIRNYVFSEQTQHLNNQMSNNTQ